MFLALTKLFLISITFVFLIAQLSQNNGITTRTQRMSTHSETNTLLRAIGDGPDEAHRFQTLQVDSELLAMSKPKKSSVKKAHRTNSMHISNERMHKIDEYETVSQEKNRITDAFKTLPKERKHIGETETLSSEDQKHIDDESETEAHLQDDEAKTRLERTRANVIRTCKTSSYPNRTSKTKYIEYAPGRLRWCLIPKSGSTFLQNTLQPTLKINGPSVMGRSKSFILVREPYSRLVSAFFSKIIGHPRWWLLFGTNIISKYRPSASNQSKECGHDVTFGEFIQFVADFNENWPYKIDPHFRPMSRICNVCNETPDYIAKIESVKDDMKYILQSVNVTGDTEKVFIEVRHLAELFTKRKRYYKHCAPMCTLLNRFWWGQQATGLIADDLELPVKGKACDDVTGEQLADFAWNAHVKSLGRFDKREQKRKASLNLWRQIPMKDRLRIQKIFAHDCDLFGYDKFPDVVFPEFVKDHHS